MSPCAYAVDTFTMSITPSTPLGARPGQPVLFPPVLLPPVLLPPVLLPPVLLPPVLLPPVLLPLVLLPPVLLPPVLLPPVLLFKTINWFDKVEVGQSCAHELLGPQFRTVAAK